MSAHALEALGRVLDGGGEPDDVLRSVVSILAAEPDIDFAGIAFLEEGEAILGPHAGAPDESRRTRTPVEYHGARVGELWVDGQADDEFLQRVAARLSAHVLIGWDTQGEAWEP